MKKLLAILSSVGISAVSASSVVSCGFSFNENGIKGDNTQNDTPEISVVQYDSPKEKMEVNADSLKAWNALYKAYSQEYNSDKQDHEEINSDSNNDFGNDKDDGKQAQLMNSTITGLLQTWYGVIKLYSLMNIQFIWNDIQPQNIDWTSFVNDDIDDAKSMLMELLSIQKMSNNFDNYYSTMQNKVLTEDSYGGDTQTLNNDKNSWSNVYNSIHDFYITKVNSYVTKLMVTLKLKDPLFIEQIIAGEYLKFDDDFDNEIISGKDNSIEIKNYKTTDLKLDNISLFDSNGKQISTSLESIVSLNNETNSIVINKNEILKNEYRLRIHASSTNPSVILNEVLSFMVV